MWKSADALALRVPREPSSLLNVDVTTTLMRMKVSSGTVSAGMVSTSPVVAGRVNGHGAVAAMYRLGFVGSASSRVHDHTRVRTSLARLGSSLAEESMTRSLPRKAVESDAGQSITASTGSVCVVTVTTASLLRAASPSMTTNTVNSYVVPGCRGLSSLSSQIFRLRALLALLAMILRVSPVTGLVRDVSSQPRAVRSSLLEVSNQYTSRLVKSRLTQVNTSVFRNVVSDATTERSPPMIMTYGMELSCLYTGEAVWEAAGTPEPSALYKKLRTSKRKVYVVSTLRTSLGSSSVAPDAAASAASRSVFTGSAASTSVTLHTIVRSPPHPDTEAEMSRSSQVPILCGLFSTMLGVATASGFSTVTLNPLLSVTPYGFFTRLGSNTTESPIRTLKPVPSWMLMDESVTVHDAPEPNPSVNEPEMASHVAGSATLKASMEAQPPVWSKDTSESQPMRRRDRSLLKRAYAGADGKPVRSSLMYTVIDGGATRGQFDVGSRVTGPVRSLDHSVVTEATLAPAVSTVDTGEYVCEHVSPRRRPLASP